MITIEKITEAIDLSVDNWNGNCYGVVIAILKSGLVKGHPIYGHYHGPISKDGYWNYCAGLPFVQHGWILMDNGKILDPTRWSFTSEAPYLAIFSPDDSEYAEYDEGGESTKIALRRPCPKITESDQTISLDLSDDAADLVNLLLNGEATHDKLAPAQLFWLANAPYSQLGSHVKEIYLKINEMDLAGFIPLDFKTRASREHGIEF